MSSLWPILKFRPEVALPKGQVWLPNNHFRQLCKLRLCKCTFPVRADNNRDIQKFPTRQRKSLFKIFFNFLQKFETSFFNLIIFHRFVYFFKFPKLFSSENRRKKDRHKFTSTFSTNDGRRRLIAYNWTKAKFCKNLDKSLFLTLLNFCEKTTSFG